MRMNRLHHRTMPSPIGMLRDSALGTAIAGLPDALRLVLLLGGRDGLSTREIAALAGVSPAIIESTRNRGNTLVQKELMSHLRGAS